MIAGVSPLVAELKSRAKAGRPVTIGLAGCGQMGTDIVVQLNRMPGLRFGAVAEMRPPQAKAAAALAGFSDDQSVYADSAAAISAGKLAITPSPVALARSGLIDVVIDATGKGARVIKPVKAGGRLTYDNCIPDDSLIVTQIRKHLDQADAKFHQL